MTKRHFVFLQGMPCDFFTNLADSLAALGHHTVGINICVGDAIFWRGPNTVNYRGLYKNWAVFIGSYFEKNAVTDLILLGEQRRYHKEAIEIAKRKGIRVTVTDFGYLRPDWITFEPDGMCGNSTFTKDPQIIYALAAKAPEVDLTQKYQDSTFKMARNDLIYSFSNVLFCWLYPFYRNSFNRPHPLIYFPSIGWQLFKSKRNHQNAEQRFLSLKRKGMKLFLFPLQLEHDYQITAYSPFRNLEEAIELVLASFAKYASENTHLIIKAHPWDPGFTNWSRVIDRLTINNHLTGRITYLRGGNLDEMIGSAEGMVVVNSTSGIRALQMGCPIKVMGEAVYDINGLTHQNELDTFWSKPTAPDLKFTKAFIKALIFHTQIRGVFFNKKNEPNDKVYLATRQLLRFIN